jgi:segregation and condensation protein A
MREQADIELEMPPADEAEGEEAVRVSLDGFEGPLHLLLELARARKLDLARVSVGDIAEQYIAFIAEARARNIEIAGDYLVMAAWLTLLKSRLLLPAPQRAADEPDPDQMAAALRLKLLHLELTRAAARRLDDLPQLDRDVFLNGLAQPVKVTRESKYHASLHDLLAAYCAERTKSVRKRAYQARPPRVFPLETARRRLVERLAHVADWLSLDVVTPHPADEPEAPPQTSYMASTFSAALELARDHKLELRQAGLSEPLFLRAKSLSSGAEKAQSEPQ